MTSRSCADSRLAGGESPGIPGGQRQEVQFGHNKRLIIVPQVGPEKLIIVPQVGPEKLITVPQVGPEKLIILPQEAAARLELGKESVKGFKGVNK
jgi:hypothetical protein